MFKLVWKYIKGYKKNTIVCIIGIAFSVMLIFSLVGISNRIMNSYQDMVISNSSVHDFRITNIEKEVVDEIYNEIIPDNVYKLINQWSGMIFTENESTNMFIVAVEGDWQTFHKTNLKEGKLPENLYEICLEESYCKENKINVGNDISYEVYDDSGVVHNVNFKVAGIVEDIKMGGLALYLFTNYDTMNDMEKNYGFVIDNINRTVLVAFAPYSYDDNQIQDLIFSLTQKYGPKFYGEHIENNDEKVEIFDEKGTFETISNSFYAICVVVFICMTIFIYNTISIGMTEKIRQYGTLRCIGMDNKALVKLMLLEELFYSVIGITIGIIGGKLLNSVLADKVISCFIDVGESTRGEAILPYILTVVVTIVAVFIASFSMFVKISKKNPLEMLRFTEKTKEIKAKKKFNNLMLELADRNIKRNRSKTRILISTIFISTLLIVLIGNIVTSIDYNANKTISAIAKVEVFSSFASDEPYISKEVYEQLKNEDMCRKVHWQRLENGYNIQIDGNVIEGLSSIIVYSDDLMKTLLKFNDIKSIEVDNDIAILVNDGNVSKDLDKIKLVSKSDSDELPDAKSEYDIVINEEIAMSSKVFIGSQMGSGSYIIVNENLAEKILGSFSDYTNIYIDLKSYAGIEDVKEKINSDKYTYVDLEDSAVDAQKQMTGMLIMALYMMVSVIILNIFVISNLIKSNITLRAKEIGMLRSIGTEKSWVEKSIVSEILLIAIKGIITAGILALPVSIYVYNIMNSEMGIGYGGYIIGIPVILIGIYLISKVIIKKCLKAEITDIIRIE